MTIDPEIARPLLAGFISGVAVAFGLTALLLIAMSRSDAWRRRAAQLPVPLTAAGVVVTNGLLLVCTLAGLLLGAVYPVIEEHYPQGGVGSPTWMFTALVVAFVVTVPLAAWFVRGSTTRVEWLGAAIIAVAFGWMLPGLAALG